MISCGIDFGTSNSAIAVTSADAQPYLAPVEGADLTLPSAIFYPRGGAPLYGRAGQATFFEGHEGRFMRSLKRMLGTELMNFGTIVNDRPRRFEEIIGGFISHLKKSGEFASGTELTSVVMGRPVHFVDGDAGADFAAETQLGGIARAAGFKDISFQYEPIAAAFAHEQALEHEHLALVADIGGGTSDFTVIRIGGAARKRHDRRDDILGNSGIRTGGNDFDKSFSLSSFMPALGYGTVYGPQRLQLPRAPFHDLSEWARINFVYAPKTVNELRAACDDLPPVLGDRLMKVLEDELGHQLLSKVELAKIMLSDGDKTTPDLRFIDSMLDLSVTDVQLGNAVAPHLADIADCLDACLQQAQTPAAKIDICVLTGGPTAMPALALAIQSRLPQARISSGDRLASVARGLGYAAGRIFAG